MPGHSGHPAADLASRLLRQAGSNGVAAGAGFSAGDSVGVTGTVDTSTKYGSASTSAGVSAGGIGGGASGGVTTSKGSVNVAMCGTVEFEVGVDLCVNGTVNYGAVAKGAVNVANDVKKGTEDAAKDVEKEGSKDVKAISKAFKKIKI